MKTHFNNFPLVSLSEQVMKVVERIVDGLIRQVVSIHDSQFVSVRHKDAIFVIRQLQEKYLAANKRLYVAFIDLEKAYDQMPRKVIWWALRKLGVDSVPVTGNVFQCQEPCLCWLGVQ